VTFGGRHDVTIAPGSSVLSDPVKLSFVQDPDDLWLSGRKLAVSFHVAGDTGPMTWHAKALTTSYVSAPGSGSRGAETGEASFPYSTTSWYFLDAIDMQVAPATHAVVAFGDSITDGTASTLNGDDRWPDVFARRMHAAFGDRFSVVNAGIGGNMVIGPADYAQHPFAGGPAALERLERDVISLPGVSAVIWLEGINDFGNAGASVDAVEAGVRQGVQRLRARLPGVRIIMATLTSSLHSTNEQYGSPEVESKRQADGRWLLLNMLDDTRHFAPTCRALDLTDLLDDPRFADTAARAEHRVALHDRLGDAIAGRPLAELRRRLDAKDTIVSALASPLEVIEDPQVLANGYFAAHPTRPSVRLATAPMQFDDEQTVVRRPAPETGEHTDEVLGELGYPADEITALRALGAVA